MTWKSIIGAAAAAALVACAGSSDQGAMDTGYVNDADTGAAAPATQGGLEYMQPPDSTTGVSAPTGRPGTAGVPQARDADVAAPVGQNPRP